WVISTERVPRVNRLEPSSSSRLLIWRLIADCVRNSSSAASLKLRRRATASNARRLPSDSARRDPAFLSNPHQWPPRVSLDFPGELADHSCTRTRRLMMTAQLAHSPLLTLAAASAAHSRRIAAGSALRLSRGGGELTVLEGRVWLTRGGHTGDTGDHRLEAGQ